MVLPQDRMIHLHMGFSSMPFTLTLEGASDIYAFLSVMTLCVERVFLASLLQRLKYRKVEVKSVKVSTLWQGESCFPASFLRTKLSRLVEEAQHLQVPSKTGHLYRNNTKRFGWKPLPEAEPESTSAVQEPLIPTRAA